MESQIYNEGSVEKELSSNKIVQTKININCRQWSDQNARNNVGRNNQTDLLIEKYFTTLSGIIYLYY